MPLFVGQDSTDVVTPKDIRDLTGIKDSDYSFTSDDDPKELLNEILSTWINRIASHIHVRINRKVSKDDGDYLAIQDVLTRTVANVVAISQQQRSSPVVQINNFAVNILNTSEVTDKLDDELKPFIRYKKGASSGWANVFSSLEEYKG